MNTIFPNDPWPFGPAPTAGPTPTPQPASPSATVAPAAPSVGGCFHALLGLILIVNLVSIGHNLYRDVLRPSPAPSPAPVNPPAPPKPPSPPDPIADLRPKLLADGEAYGQELAWSFGQSLQDAAPQLDGKTPVATVQAAAAKAWAAKRSELFNARFTATLESIIPSTGKGPPTATQLDRYRAALQAIGQGAIKSSGAEK